jgi:hydroxyacylglutathione hydrolase
MLLQYEAAGGQLERTETIDMDELERRRNAGGVTILDVRGRAEYDVLHVPDALNIAHTRLLVRLEDVPRDQPVLVHCNSGGRSAAAASLLERHGYQATQVDDRIANWKPAAAAASRSRDSGDVRRREVSSVAGGRQT